MSSIFSLAKYLMILVCFTSFAARASDDDTAGLETLLQQRLLANSPVILSGLLNGQPVNLMLDTGASHNVFGSHVKQFLTGEILQHRSKSVEICEPQNISVGGLGNSAETEAIVVDITSMSEVVGLKVAGVLGGPFIHDRIVEIDFDEKQIRFLKGTSSWDDAIAISCDKFARPHVICLNAGNNLDIKNALIDTGMNAALSLDPQTYKQLKSSNLISEGFLIRKHIFDDEKKRLVTTKSKSGILKTLKIGDYKLTNIPVQISTSNKIGLNLLKKFRVSLDLHQFQLKLTKGLTFDEPFELRDKIKLGKGQN